MYNICLGERSIKNIIRNYNDAPNEAIMIYSLVSSWLPLTERNDSRLQKNGKAAYRKSETKREVTLHPPLVGEVLWVAVYILNTYVFVRLSCIFVSVVRNPEFDTYESKKRLK